MTVARHGKGVQGASIQERAVIPMRAIDADALIDKLPKEYLGSTIHLLINDAPTVSTEVVQGEWIKTVDGNGWDDWENLTCSKCGKKQEQVPYYYNFCPNCGARMKISEDTTKESEEIGCVY